MATSVSNKIAIPARYHMTPYPIARWQGANPNIDPYEILMVINTDGSLSVRANKNDNEVPFNQTVVLLDENQMAAVIEAYSNIKPYLERAERAAQNAETSETHAATSESNAKASETAAAASETASAKSAAAASQSADRAADAASVANTAASSSSTAAATAQDCLTQIQEAGGIAADTLKQAQALSTASAGIRYYRDDDGDLCYEMIN